MNRQSAMRDEFKNAGDDAAFQSANKKAKSQARQDFGLMGSTY